jgi:hypothetical protein
LKVRPGATPTFFFTLGTLVGGRIDSEISFGRSQIRIDNAIQYSDKRGKYLVPKEAQKFHL